MTLVSNYYLYFRFIYVPYPFTKKLLCYQLLECLIDKILDRIISALTVDNCLTNDAMIEVLLDRLDGFKLFIGGCSFHMRCGAHILNLIVKDVIDVIKVGIENIQKSVSYWTSTPKRRKDLKKQSDDCIVQVPKNWDLIVQQGEIQHT